MGRAQLLHTDSLQAIVSQRIMVKLPGWFYPEIGTGYRDYSQALKKSTLCSVILVGQTTACIGVKPFRATPVTQTQGQLEY